MKRASLILVLFIAAISFSVSSHAAILTSDRNAADEGPVSISPNKYAYLKYSVPQRDNSIIFSMSNSRVHKSYLQEKISFGPTYKKELFGPDMDLPPVVHETVQIGKALLTNFAIHELGHKVMADYAEAKGTKFNLMTEQDGTFFLGQSTFDEIDDESRLSFSIAGEVAADMTFEHALQSYRKSPDLYNKSLLVFSGTDFLMYCVYAFYLTDGHAHYDPTAIAHETGLSKDKIISIALAKTLINAYRVYSGKDYVVPYFTADKNSATLNVSISF